MLTPPWWWSNRLLCCMQLYTSLEYYCCMENLAMFALWNFTSEVFSLCSNIRNRNGDLGNFNGSIRTFHQQDTETVGNNSMHGTTTSTCSSQSHNLPFAQLLEKLSPQAVEQLHQILYKLPTKDNEQSMQASVSTGNTANTSKVTFHTEEPTKQPATEPSKTHKVMPSKPPAEPMDIDQE